MYDEISFLFNNNSMKNYSSDNTEWGMVDPADIFNKNNAIINIRSNDRIVGSKSLKKNEIINELNDNSYLYGSSNDDNRNPYLKIVEKLGEIRQMKISTADIAYLTELGVYPVNRLVILRRYAENVVVPHDLNDMEDNIEPISTVIGWVNPDDEKLFNITFQEKWETTNDMFWDTISDIVSQETGISLKAAMPVPSWGQGFLFQFLDKAGFLPDGASSKYIPIGDPDVLKESSTREVNSQGLDSSFSFKLETSYEQKYINGIDPGSAMMDIINNTLRMGTSDMKYILGGKIKEFQKIVTDGEASDWVNKIKELSILFTNTVYSMIEHTSADLIAAVASTETDEETEGNSWIEDAFTAGIRRFRWPLKGSLGVVSGLHTTPWHLTVGNPLNPIISIGNVIVDGELSFGNEMGFNDMPTKINATFNVKLGRSLGKNEIIEILDNTYGREYSQIQPDGLTTTNENPSEQPQDPLTNPPVIPVPYANADPYNGVINNSNTVNGIPIIQ